MLYSRDEASRSCYHNTKVAYVRDFLGRRKSKTVEQQTDLVAESESVVSSTESDIVVVDDVPDKQNFPTEIKGTNAKPISPPLYRTC